MDSSICFDTALDLAKAIKDRKMSAREVVEIHLKQISRINPHVNAIVALDEDRALQEADKADDKLAKGHKVGPFHGLPIAIKDTANAKGFPTTIGFVPLRNNIAKEDDLLVERLRGAGAIIIGKTNVPEFAAGAHTFNEVYGMTRNPYDLSRSAAGSSGGAAVALATGMLPFADGSDMGGSLRIPAAFNNVVGMRPSPGCVPTYPKLPLYSTLAVQGPMARNVKDTAFLMSVIAGADNRSPISIDGTGDRFLEPFKKDITGLRVAWSIDLGGIYPVDNAVRENIEEQVKVFEDLGCHVEEAYPDLTEADEVFHVLRAWEFEMSKSELFDKYESFMKPTFVWNFKKGRDLRGVDIGRAERLRNNLFHKTRIFFDKYDVFILPVGQVPPFDAMLEYPKEINDLKMETYLDWLRSCYYISVVGNPSISVPSGFTNDGLPLGLQIVGPHRKDYEVLRVAYAYEQATNYGKQRPDIAGTSL